MRLLSNYSVLSLAIVLLLLPACRPKGVLTRSQMEDVLVDIHAAEGVLEEAGLAYGHDEAQRAYYNVVLRKHHITQEQFDSSLVWYTAHPQVFDKIYPKVQDRLTARMTEFDRECDYQTEQAVRLREMTAMEEMQDSAILHIQSIIPEEAVLVSKYDNPLFRPMQHDSCMVDTIAELDTIHEQTFFIRSCVLLRSESTD